MLFQRDYEPTRNLPKSQKKRVYPATGNPHLTGKKTVKRSEKDEIKKRIDMKKMHSRPHEGRLPTENLSDNGE